MNRYVGKWYAISGSVNDVFASSGLGTGPDGKPIIKPKPLVFLNFAQGQGTLFLSFEDKWDSEIELLNKGDRISAYCKIESVSDLQFRLDHCQIVRR